MRSKQEDLLKQEGLEQLPPCWVEANPGGRSADRLRAMSGCYANGAELVPRQTSVMWIMQV